MILQCNSRYLCRISLNHDFEEKISHLVLDRHHHVDEHVVFGFCLARYICTVLESRVRYMYPSNAIESVETLSTICNYACMAKRLHGNKHA